MPEVLEETLPSRVELKAAEEASPQDFGTDSESIHGIHFKLPVFEGPLELLLHLIKANKIDIYDIPIVEITQQYLDYIEMMKELDLEIAGEFLVMAATLIHIKSRMLLPPAEKENEESVEDPRAELVKRLLEYQAYKETSTQLRKREELWKNIFRRALPDEKDFEFDDEPVFHEAGVFDLISAFHKLLSRSPVQTLEITRETLTTADRINYIVGRLENEKGVRFEDLFEKGFSRLMLIVTFLALLEVIRLGLAKIYQKSAFKAIWIINPQHEDFPLPEDAAADETGTESSAGQA